MGFFRNNAGEFAPRYIRAMEMELTPAELRQLAEALDQGGQYTQSIRIVSRYFRQQYFSGETNDPAGKRRDLELLFPRPYMELVEHYAAETGQPPALLYGLIRTESAFQSGVVSSAGAVGLTQLIPSTAEEMAARIRRSGGPDYRQRSEDNSNPLDSEQTLDLTDPEVNIHIGAYYLNYLIERFDDPLLAFLAYNGGMNRVRRWRAASTLPADLFMETVEFRETRDYGRKILAAAAVYNILYY
jgi:soluble lytic murein transglycosylase